MARLLDDGPWPKLSAVILTKSFEHGGEAALPAAPLV